MSIEEKIIPVEIVEEMQDSFMEYSMSVIVQRALPDVRDGLKPVHRRILYTMFENGLTPDKAYRKCADTVGSVLGRYHPHGDASVYDALVRMAQDFSLRYMLVDGHGNFGSVDGYPAAAYRYTEARMSKMATDMMDDINKDTVDWTTNYDDRLKEPSVLPARFPNLLVNGSSGIAVGMATNIPPHNLCEVIDGMCHLIDNPEADMVELNQFIKGPDFPTGGIIMGSAGIRAAYATGRGKVVTRARCEIEEITGNKYRIVVSEIPYMVNKQALVKSMNDLVDEKRIDGVDYVTDYSNREGIRIEIDLKRDASPQLVLSQLYKYTQLQTTFGVILLALVNGQPKTLTLKEMLQHYIDHQEVIVRRRTEYDLRKAQERAHILEGLKIALDFIEEVIKILRAAKTVNEGKEQLIERFGLDDIQATAIVQMRLGQLTGLERVKIEDELAALMQKITEWMEILADVSKILAIVKDEALKLRDRYNDERRTEISPVSGEVDIEDLIPIEESVLTLTNMGYIKRLPSDTYKLQRRGGRGISAMTQKEEDITEHMFVCSSHDYIMFFTNHGRTYKLKAYEVPEGSRTSRGINIVNILQLSAGETVTTMLKIPEFEDDMFLTMVTKKGIIKRTSLNAYANVRKNGVNAINIDEDDELKGVLLTSGDEEILIATKKGWAVRFKENVVRPLSRNARGVKAVRLKADDEVVGMVEAKEGSMILTVSETGFGRRSLLEDYRLSNRGVSGVINYRVAVYGDVAGIKVVEDDDDLIIISSDGIIIRTLISQINISKRGGKGVKVMRVNADEKVITIATAKHEDDALVEALPIDDDVSPEDDIDIELLDEIEGTLDSDVDNEEINETADDSEE